MGESVKAKSLMRLQKHLACIAYHPKQDATVVAVKSGNKTAKVALAPVPAIRATKPFMACKGLGKVRLKSAIATPYGKSNHRYTK